jgi:hypothetical protein
MVRNGENIRSWKDAVLAFFWVLSHNSPNYTEEKRDKLQSIQLAAQYACCFQYCLVLVPFHQNSSLVQFSGKVNAIGC